jgi:hypothetical protein
MQATFPITRRSDDGQPITREAPIYAFRNTAAWGVY